MLKGRLSTILIFVCAWSSICWHTWWLGPYCCSRGPPPERPSSAALPGRAERKRSLMLHRPVSWIKHIPIHKQEAYGIYSVFVTLKFLCVPTVILNSVHLGFYLKTLQVICILPFLECLIHLLLDSILYSILNSIAQLMSLLVVNDAAAVLTRSNAAVRLKTSRVNWWEPVDWRRREDRRRLHTTRQFFSASVHEHRASGLVVAVAVGCREGGHTFDNDGIDLRGQLWVGFGRVFPAVKVSK